MPVRHARLTRPSIRRLKSGEKVTEHGISAERLLDGDIRYSVNIMVDGQRIHRVIGRESEGVTRHQAKIFIESKRTEAREARLSLPKGRKIPLTFARAAEIYIKQQEEVDGRDLESKKRHLKLHLKPFFGTMQTERITKFTVEKFRTELRRKGMAEGGIVRVLATYRHMGRQLHDAGVIPAPFPIVTIGRLKNRREFVLNLSDEVELLDAALKDSNSYVWLFIKIGLATSLRHSEILSTRFEDLNTTRRRLRVWVKGGERRDQPLTREITDILVRERGMAKDQGGWIFPNPATRSGHINSMKKAFKRCVLRANLDPTRTTPHTMRHTAITNLSETGADPRTIQAFSGHKSEEMVFRYTHARDARVDDALERMEKAKTEAEQNKGQDRQRS